MSRTVDKERDDRLMAALEEETARLLYPERFVEPARVTLVFPLLDGDSATAAAEFLEAAESVDDATDPTRPGDPPRRRATYRLADVEALHGLYAVLEAAVDPADMEILIGARRLPLVRELWLPLLWSLRS